MISLMMEATKSLSNPIAGKALRSGVAATTDFSLSEITKLTNVQPLTIISSDCLNLEYLPDINNSVLSIFAAYYLQAVSLLGSLQNVEVIRTLDRLNPDRDLSGVLFGMESIQDTYKYSLLPPTVSLEADGADTKTLMEMTNLSVGKLLNVDIGYNGTDKEGRSTNSKVTIPINIRLMVSSLSVNSIVKLLTSKADEITLTERFHKWRSGRINYIKDLILCEDLIREYKQSMMSNDSATINEIVRRANNAKKYGVVTSNFSLATASNIFIISEVVAKQLESSLGGKLSNLSIRNKAFEKTYAMLLVVVDREWERVTIYTKGNDAHTDLSIKEIKSVNKGKGIDIADVMKSLQSGSSFL